MRALASRTLVFLLALGGAGLGAGCGSSSSADLGSSVTLAATDAASDEIASFVVRIASVELARSDGLEIDVLPEPFLVDFAALEDVSRVLNLTVVPPGTYDSATVTLDLTDASVVLVGKSVAATVRNGDGASFDVPLELPVQLGGALVVALRENRVLELDFDLDQSVDVDWAANEVRVEPGLVVRVDPAQPKELALGGSYRVADVFLQRFWLAIETSPTNPNLLVPVEVDANTVFQIDGVPIQGMSGFLDLVAHLPGTWVQVFGSADPDAALIRATTVEVGAGTYNGGSDIVEGHIVARSGGPGSSPTLTVLGHSNNAIHTVFLYDRPFTVTTDVVNTKVVRRGSALMFDTDDLNVGQRVRVFGALDQPSLTIAANTATDVIRLQPTRAKGYALGAPNMGGLEVDLERVDKRGESVFSWLDGGISQPDPDMLQVWVGTLGDTLAIDVGTPVEALGFFSGVDDNDEDFAADALVNRALERWLVAIHDRSGGFVVVPAIAVDEVRFTITGTIGADELALVDSGFAGASGLPSVPDPRFVPANPAGLGFYSTRDRVTGDSATFTQFANFAAALDQMLLGGAVVYNFGASGVYDVGMNEMAANVISVVVQ